MRRMLSVWLPDWPIDRLRRASPGAVPDEAPFALALAADSRLVLTAVTASARSAGLAPGKALADARAAVPALLTRPAEPARDLLALQRLALWLGRYGPLVHLEDPLSRVASARSALPSRGADDDVLLRMPDGAAVDVTGVAHLFGGEEKLLADLARRLRALGIGLRAAIADTAGAAHALARHAPTDRTIAPPGSTRERLHALPVEALRIAPRTALALRRLGLKRIGDLYPLPRAALARRFASREAAEAVLERLDQALGVKAEPRRPLRTPPDLAVRLPFPEPLLAAEGFEAALAEAVLRLCADLAALGRGARSVRLEAYRSDGTRASAAIGLSRASRSAPHLLALLQAKSAGLDLGFGVDLLELAARRTEPLAPRQSLIGGGEAAGRAGALDELVDRLANRLGADRLLRLTPGTGHIPERAERLLPALGNAPAAAAGPRKHRPPFLLDPPEPVAVLAEIPDGPPARLLWRRKARRIVRAEGPERIAGEWWRPALGLATSSPTLERTRDYYTVEDEDGGRYWIFRAGLYGEGEGTPAWYLHGLYG